MHTIVLDNRTIRFSLLSYNLKNRCAHLDQLNLYRYLTPPCLPQQYFSSFSSYTLCIIIRQHLVVVVVLGRLTLVIAIDIKEVVGNKIDIFVFVSLEEVSHELTVAAAVRSTPPAWLPESSVATTGIFLSANAFLPPTPKSIFI